VIRAADGWCRARFDLECHHLKLPRAELGLDPPLPTPMTADQPTQGRRRLIRSLLDVLDAGTVRFGARYPDPA